MCIRDSHNVDGNLIGVVFYISLSDFQSVQCLDIICLLYTSTPVDAAVPRRIDGNSFQSRLLAHAMLNSQCGADSDVLAGDHGMVGNQGGPDSSTFQNARRFRVQMFQLRLGTIAEIWPKQ